MTPFFATAAEVDAAAATRMSAAPASECRNRRVVRGRRAPEGAGEDPTRRRGRLASGYRVAAQPAPATTARTATSGRRAAIAWASTRQKPKIARTTTPCIFIRSSPENGTATLKKPFRPSANRSATGTKKPRLSSGAGVSNATQRAVSDAGTVRASRSSSVGASAGASASASTAPPSRPTACGSSSRSHEMAMRNAGKRVDRGRPNHARRLGAGAAPSAAASESPRRTTATATPAAWRRSSSGSIGVGRPTKLGASTHTTLTPCPASARCTSLVASGAGDPRGHDHGLDGPRGGPAVPREELDDRTQPIRSAAARTPSAASQSPSSDETRMLGRDAELTASTARRPWDACERRIEPAARTCSSKLVPATALAPRRGRPRSRHAARLRAPSPSAGLAARSSASAPFAATRPARTRAPSGGRIPTAAAAAACGRPARAPRSPRRADRARRAGGRRAASRAAVQIDLRAREPERVVDRRLRLLDDVAAARHLLDHVRAAVGAAGALERRVRARPASAIRSVTEIDGSRHARLGLALERHPDVFALEEVPATRAAEPPPIRRRCDRPGGEPDPGPRGERRQHEPDGDRVERLRAEEPGDDVDRDTQERASARRAWSCARPGPGSAPRFADDLLRREAGGARLGRQDQPVREHGPAIALTSSGST